MDHIADLVQRIKASADPAEVRRLAAVLRERLSTAETESATPPPASPTAPDDIHAAEAEWAAALPWRRQGVTTLVVPRRYR